MRPPRTGTVWAVLIAVSWAVVAAVVFLLLTLAQWLWSLAS